VNIVLGWVVLLALPAVCLVRIIWLLVSPIRQYRQDVRQYRSDK